MTALAEQPAFTAESLRVELGNHSYPIVIGTRILDRTGDYLAPLLRKRRVIVVTDANVGPLYLDAALASLARGDIAVDALVLPAGEPTKDFAHLEDLCDRLLEARVERTTTLIALGGGVIGDITGFAAGILLRGLDYVQIPTTLLAQVDSSVGGKTGINTRRGKNLVGLFYQPRMVLADMATLATLDVRQRRAGYAEVVKYGLIGDAAFFSWLEDNGSAVCEGDSAACERAVRTSCAAKAAIVAADEREAGPRALLNLGHTFAHALETEAGYGSDLLHGEAVGLGMVMAFALSARLGLCPSVAADKVRRHLELIGLPAHLSATLRKTWSAEALITHMAHDKKIKDGQPRFVLARDIGKAFVGGPVEIKDVVAVLRQAGAA